MRGVCVSVLKCDSIGLGLVPSITSPERRHPAAFSRGFECGQGERHKGAPESKRGGAGAGAGWGAGMGALTQW